ncbi:MAG: DNA polymerase ligase N-terminal domain-containing protein, partial [Akkermansiaceae bacterium]
MPPRKAPAKKPTAPLDRYREKRDFEKSPEPGADSIGGSGRSFVVQEHHARSHHFDFRLEMDGVLVSWAVPKGIPKDPAAKRLAVHVEDHPLEYAGFEGVIPKGSYGAGTVAIWDQGEWEPLEKSWRESFAKGKLKFLLKGGLLGSEGFLGRIWSACVRLVRKW